MAAQFGLEFRTESCLGANRRPSLASRGCVQNVSLRELGVAGVQMVPPVPGEAAGAKGGRQREQG